MAQPLQSKNIFTLTKYSRAVFQQLNNSRVAQAWHHHTQPTLRLLLELRKSPQGVPESARMRVVWTVSKASDRPSQENVILEDIDLMEIRKHVHPFQTHSLPLKAVFRDNMFGIRFLPPQAKSSTQSEYRRFQVTFLDPHAAAAIVEAIRDVCPCKPSPVNNVFPSPSIVSACPERNNMVICSQSALDPFQTQAQPLIHQIPSASQLNAIVPAAQLSNDHSPLSSQTAHSLSLPHEFSLLPQPFHQDLTASRLDKSSNYASSLSCAPARHNTVSCETHFARSSSPYRPQPRPDLPLHQRAMSLIDTRDLQESRSESATSSQTLSCNIGSTADPLKERTTAITTGFNNEKAPASAKDPILTSLNETCKLNCLTQEELEQLVAQIVNEDGFEKLLENIDKLWRIKVLVNP
ncbi:hypothetical protein M0805_001712 [Coniferiporia weirii]|nr:hypothetical protein M0805_001712 [Coniferiporia weirii]